MSNFNNLITPINFPQILPQMGHEVVLIKGGTRACGSGGALATAPLVQSKSYFEVKLQQSGHWAIGLATSKTDLNEPRGGSDVFSWCLTSDNCIRHDDKVVHELKGGAPPEDRESLTDVLLEIQTTDDVRLSQLGIPAEGDTIGVSFDHVELNFYLNGKNLEVPVLSVRGTVYPALYGKMVEELAGVHPLTDFCLLPVDDGAILDIVLDNFKYGPPSGYDRIMLEQSLL